MTRLQRYSENKACFGLLSFTIHHLSDSENNAAHTDRMADHATTKAIKSSNAMIILYVLCMLQKLIENRILD